MKRIIGLLFIVLSLSCCSKSETDKEEGGNYVLSIAPQNLKFPANGDSQNVIVASNGQWSLSGGDSWCTPSITSGGNGANVTFSVEKNMELQPRNTSFTFTLGNEKATLHVTQEAAPNSNISLNPGSATVSSNSNTQSVIVTCNGTWALSGETVSWCRPSKTTGQNNDVVTFNIDENNLSDDRNATYTFTCATESAKFVLTQKGKDALTVTKSKFEVSAQGEQIAVEVNANISFEYEIAQADKSWISYVGTRAMTTSRLLFSISPNEETATREGTITITSEIGKETIKIYQFGVSPVLVLTQKEYIVPSDGQTIKVELNSNVDYEVAMPSVDWITESPTRAISTHTHYYTIAENLYGEDRSSEIHFRCREHNIDEIVVIRQSSVQSIEPPLLTDEDGPYYAISSLNHLIWLSEQYKKSYPWDSSMRFVQMSDIDMKNYAFTPIGTRKAGFEFRSNYDGNGYRLYNLRIDLPEEDNVGLFGAIGFAQISNIYIASGNISGRYGVGGIAGYARSDFERTRGSIIGCRNNATIKGLSYVGGIVGQTDAVYAQIIACANDGAVIGQKYCGGIAGSINIDTSCDPSIQYGITACYNTGNITGEDIVGGIVGHTKNLWIPGASIKIIGASGIEYCYNTGVITSSGVVGGIIGYHEGAARQIYNIGKVVYTGSSTNPLKGGLCGEFYIGEYRHISKGFWLRYNEKDKAIGTEDKLPANHQETYNSFSSKSWPTDHRMDWPIKDNSWKSLGHWVEGGTPNGINSEFPKLYFEE